MKDMHVCEEERNINNGESVAKTEEQSVDPNPNPNYQTQDQTVNWVEEVVTPEDREMWFEREQEDLLDVNDAFISYGDFPPLPDFPCISSSSSSSSSDPPVVANSMKCSASSSSSSSSLASWALVKPDGENCMKNMKNHHQQEDLMSMSSMEVSMQEINPMDSDCMDVIEELRGMDLLDTDLWDPSSLFPFENNTEEEEQQQQEQLVIQQEGLEEKQEAKPSEDLAMLFFEWLKSNKESISAEDLRSIRLKRSTIECAAKRLGGGKEGMKQLLKLILEWVQNHQLQKKRIREGGEPITFPYQHQQNPQHHYQNPNPNPNPDSNPYIIPSTAAATTPWISQPPYISDPMTMSGAFPPMVGYMGDPVFNNGGFATVPFNPEYQMMDSSPNWPQQQFSFSTHYNSYPDHHLHHQRHLPPAQSRSSRAFTAFANQYPCQLYQSHADQLVRFGSSATKEARKKRMARQRRLFSHHRSQNQQQNRNQNPTVPTAEKHERFSSDSNCTSTHANQANWVFWPSSSSVGASTMLVPDALPHPMDRPPLQPQHHQRQINLDRRHGFKTGTEKNLKFLLQKVLKQSDVGNLGRIVLPKKEAETYLPELEARDGISIAMEDIGTSRIWNMRYRFWPNNKSRMYLLENTGDFVRSNGLQEGDFIVIYSDVKCGKYLIRGVKVRQPGSRSEGKKHGKVQRKLRATSVAGGIGSSSSVKGKQ